MIRTVHLAYLCAVRAGRPDDRALKHLLRHALELGYPASGLSTLTTWHCPMLTETQLDQANGLRQQYAALLGSDDYLAMASAPSLPWMTAIELVRAWPQPPSIAECEQLLQTMFDAWRRHADYESRGFDKRLASLARACMADAAARSPLDVARLHLQAEEGADDEDNDQECNEAIDRHDGQAADQVPRAA